MKTVIGLFDNFTEARETLHDLVNSGFKVDDISILANGLLGQSIDAPGIDHLERMRVQGIGEIAAFGPLVNDIEMHDHEELQSDVLVRALSDTGVPVETAQSFVDGVRRGGTLETVKVEDDEVHRVVAIMKLHASSGVAREEIVLEEMYEETVPDELADEDDANLSPATAAERIDEQGERDVQNQPLDVDEPLDLSKDENIDDADRKLDDEPKKDATPLAAAGGATAAAGAAGAASEALRSRKDVPDKAQEVGTEVRSNIPEDSAHRFGEKLRSDERFGGSDWSKVEEHAKQTWESKNPDTWEHIKDVVRHAWEKVRGKA